MDERPLSVLPKLATRIGLNEALSLQQLHWLLEGPSNGRKIADHKWIFNTVDEWRAQYFPFWSAATVKRTFANLARMNLIVTIQPEGRISRRKYYRVNTEEVRRLSEGVNLIPSSRSNCADGKRSKRTVPITETTAETSEQRETKEDASESAKGFAARAVLASPEEFSAKWMPDERTKAEKLKTIRPPKKGEYPSQFEFLQFIETAELDHIGMGKRDPEEIYGTLCDHKWREWRGTRWKKIYDWRAYITALNAKMEEATTSGNRF